VMAQDRRLAQPAAVADVAQEPAWRCPARSNMILCVLGQTVGMDLWPWVLSPRCRTEATGRVVAVAGRVWFEPALPVRLIRYAPGRAPAPPPSGWGVPVLGVDLQHLDRSRSKAGTSEGFAHLRGHWTEDALVGRESGRPGIGRCSSDPARRSSSRPALRGERHGP
jgi:hypothetical protein